MKAQVGIDLSMNSTGLVFILPQENAEPIMKFIQICPGLEKVSGSVQLVTYKRDYRKDNYSYTDLATVESAISLAKCIAKEIQKFAQLHNITSFDARIEGSMLSTGFQSKWAKLSDLSVYNSTTKRMLMTNPLVISISVVAPSSLKKYAVNKGNAKKDAIVKKFLEIFPNFDNKGKIDDVADAYFLSIAPIPENQKFIK